MTESREKTYEIVGRRPTAQDLTTLKFAMLSTYALAGVEPDQTLAIAEALRQRRGYRGAESPESVIERSILVRVAGRRPFAAMIHNGINSIEIDLSEIECSSSAPIAVIVAGALTVAVFSLMGKPLNADELPFRRHNDGTEALSKSDIEAVYRIAETVRIDDSNTITAATNPQTH